MSATRQQDLHATNIEAHQVMHPANLVQLAHDGIDPGVACFASLPCAIVLLILVPVDLHRGVAMLVSAANETTGFNQGTLLK